MDSLTTPITSFSRINSVHDSRDEYPTNTITTIQSVETMTERWMREAELKTGDAVSTFSRPSAQDELTHQPVYKSKNRYKRVIVNSVDRNSRNMMLLKIKNQNQNQKCFFLQDFLAKFLFLNFNV